MVRGAHDARDRARATFPTLLDQAVAARLAAKRAEQRKADRPEDGVRAAHRRVVSGARMSLGTGAGFSGATTQPRLVYMSATTAVPVVQLLSRLEQVTLRTCLATVGNLQM